MQNKRKTEIATCTDEVSRVCVSVSAKEGDVQQKSSQAALKTQLLALQGSCLALLAGTRSIDRCPQPLASPPQGPR